VFESIRAIFTGYSELTADNLLRCKCGKFTDSAYRELLKHLTSHICPVCDSLTSAETPNLKTIKNVSDHRTKMHGDRKIVVYEKEYNNLQLSANSATLKRKIDELEAENAQFRRANPIAQTLQAKRVIAESVLERKRLRTGPLRKRITLLERIIKDNGLVVPVDTSVDVSDGSDEEDEAGYQRTMVTRSQAKVVAQFGHTLQATTEPFQTALPPPQPPVV